MFCNLTDVKEAACINEGHKALTGWGSHFSGVGPQFLTCMKNHVCVCKVVSL